MIKLSALKLNPNHTKEDLIAAAAKAVGLLPLDIIELTIQRRSVEARKKEALSLVYTVFIRTDKDISAFLRTRKGKTFAAKHSIQFVEKEEPYQFPTTMVRPDHTRPLIIGSGPAGLLCAYELAKNGYRPILVERGQDAKTRTQKAELFWSSGKLDPECNIQFGEGGAGTFSDGKLNTGVTDRNGRSKEVLSLFVRCGADESILYDAKPHIGSDVLLEMVQKIRQEILTLGGTVHFEKRADDLLIKDGCVSGVLFSDGETILTDKVVLAIGHSARDTFRMLFNRGVKMSPKAFAIGVRCEHDQEMINRSQWGEDYPTVLGAAPYKLTHKAANGRSVYTFCMCPGGYVVNASSEEGRLCINGMSLHGRSGKNANSAVIVSVTPKDFSGYCSASVPIELAGIEFQRDLEKKAYQEGNGCIPAQRFLDFTERRKSLSLPKGSVKGQISAGNLTNIYPSYICEALEDGIQAFDQKISGFKDTVLYGVESRTSSPVRVLRDDTLQSNIKGLYPCGEGAGYAGGILSAAMDGIKVAEAVAISFC